MDIMEVLAPSPSGRKRLAELDRMRSGDFDNISQAFDCCREANHPMSVTVAGERWTIFPSGQASPNPCGGRPAGQLVEGARGGKVAELRHV